MQEDTETEKGALSLSGLKRWLQSKPTRLIDGALRALILILILIYEGHLNERALTLILITFFNERRPQRIRKEPTTRVNINISNSCLDSRSAGHRVPVSD